MVRESLKKKGLLSLSRGGSGVADTPCDAANTLHDAANTGKGCFHFIHSKF